MTDEHDERHWGFTATYSPDDNKLRLYAATRLSPELYAKVKAAGFSWAPKQELFVAPMWTPGREDLLLELAGEIGDEDTSLTDRAEQRAERFEEYSEKRAADSEAAHAAVSRIADGIPFGQPILVGHHSERHARKDAERIENGMRKAVKMWDTSKYWTSRAAGALHHAKYKELPAVRARRIKKIEADARRVERSKAEAEKALRIWGDLHARQVNKPDGTSSTFAERALYIAGRTHTTSHEVYNGLSNGTLSPEEAQRRTVEMSQRAVEHCERWLTHYANRLTYERAMLAESGYTPPPKPKTKSDLPLLNYPGEVAYRNPYHKGEIIRGQAVGITKAELAEVNTDYKGTRLSECGTHRVRTAYLKVNGKRELVALFLTDSKQHPRPTVYDKAVAAADEREAQDKALEAATRRAEARLEHEPPAVNHDMEAMRASLKAGVQVVSAPQLFPTPPDLARRMAEAADIQPGQRVLEPSAGTGNLLRAILNRFAGADCGLMVAVEISPQLAAGLREVQRKTLYANDDNYSIRCADFLTCNGDLGTFHRIVMNPPFSRGADIEHIRHAVTFLKPGGRLVALCANGPRQARELQPLATEWEELPDGSFSEAGTNVRVVLLTIDKEEAEEADAHRRNAPHCGKCGHPDGHCDFDSEGRRV